MDTDTFEANDASLVDFEIGLAMGVFKDVASNLDEPGRIDHCYGAGVESVGFDDLAGKDPTRAGRFGFEVLFLFFRFGVLSFSVEQSGAGKDKRFAVAGRSIEIGLFFAGRVG